MLRGLVLLLLLSNVAVFFWVRSEPRALQADREPQRLAHQVAPEAIQVLPDLAASSASATPGAATGASASPASRVASAAPARPASAPSPVPAPTANAASTAAQVTRAAASAGNADAAAIVAPEAPTASSLALPASALVAQCAESDPLDDIQFAALRDALAKAGVPSDALSERRQSQPGVWMVYMGRFPDEQAWQHKADELQHMGMKFDRVTAPPGLDPGLSLGRFKSAAEAASRLEELGKHGVHTARVVQATAPATLRRLQVRTASDHWRGATGNRRFGACPVQGAATL